MKISCIVHSVSLLLDDRFIYDSLLVFRPLVVYKSISDSNVDISVSTAEREMKNPKILNHSIYDFHDQVSHEIPSLRNRSTSGSSASVYKKSTKP